MSSLEDILATVDDDNIYDLIKNALKKCCSVDSSTKCTKKCFTVLRKKTIEALNGKHLDHFLIMLDTLRQFATPAVVNFKKFLTFGLSKMIKCMEKLKTMPETTLNWSSAIEEFVNVVGEIGLYSKTASNSVSCLIPSFINSLATMSSVDILKIRIEIARVLNDLLKIYPVQKKATLLKQKNIIDDICCIGDCIHEAGDFEFQGSLLECVFRLTDIEHRERFASKWFGKFNLSDQCLSLREEHFDVDSRYFLNNLNNACGINRSVYSLICSQVFVGAQKLSCPSEMNDFWIDFNIGSRCISFFAEDSDSDLESGNIWECVYIKREEVKTWKLEDHTGVLSVELYEVLPLPWSTQSSCNVLFYLSSMDHINDAMNKTIGYEKRMTTSQTVLKGKVKQSIVCAPVRISLHSTVIQPEEDDISPIFPNSQTQIVNPQVGSQELTTPPHQTIPLATPQTSTPKDLAVSRVNKKNVRGTHNKISNSTLSFTDCHVNKSSVCEGNSLISPAIKSINKSLNKTPKPTKCQLHFESKSINKSDYTSNCSSKEKMILEEDLTKQKLDTSRVKKSSQQKRKLSKNDNDDFQCRKKRKSDSSEDEMSSRKRPKSSQKSSVDHFKSVYDFPKSPSVVGGTIKKTRTSITTQSDHNTSLLRTRGKQTINNSVSFIEESQPLQLENVNITSVIVPAVVDSPFKEKMISENTIEEIMESEVEKIDKLEDHHIVTEVDEPDGYQNTPGITDHVMSPHIEGDNEEEELETSVRDDEVVLSDSDSDITWKPTVKKSPKLVTNRKVHFREDKILRSDIALLSNSTTPELALISATDEGNNAGSSPPLSVCSSSLHSSQIGPDTNIVSSFQQMCSALCQKKSISETPQKKSITKKRNKLDSCPDKDAPIKKSHSTPLATSTSSTVTSFEEELQHYCDMAVNGLDNISKLSVALEEVREERCRQEVIYRSVCSMYDKLFEDLDKKTLQVTKNKQVKCQTLAKDGQKLRQTILKEAQQREIQETKKTLNSLLLYCNML